MPLYCYAIILLCYVTTLGDITGHYYHYIGIGITELLRVRAVQPNALPLVLR